MSDSFIELKPRAIREARAECGCAFVLAWKDSIDTREARFVGGTEIVVVPCRDEHVELAREVALPFVGDPASLRLLPELAAALNAACAA